jgi:glutamate synthase (NADPH/NADH) small chain
MGKETGFLEIDRKDAHYDPVGAAEALQGIRRAAAERAEAAGARCMNCGIPYCHNGCPVNNQIPDWNHLVYEDDWKDALDNLHSTNNFPEFTGRICPAPCEAACTLNIDDQPVTIKSIECAIVDKGWQRAGSRRRCPRGKTGKRSRWSAPARRARLRAAAGARRPLGDGVREGRPIGGLLRYGIPDFKMEKHHIDRRMRRWRPKASSSAPASRSASRVGRALLEDFDAVVAVRRRRRPARPRHSRRATLDGVHFAMDFLTQQNKRNAGDDEAARRAARHAHRHRQACRRHRRRRHRVRLRRHLEPPGRRLRSPSSRSCPSRR